LGVAVGEDEVGCEDDAVGCDVVGCDDDDDDDEAV
jgi:hypothetical protein